MMVPVGRLLLSSLLLHRSKRISTVRDFSVTGNGRLGIKEKKEKGLGLKSSDTLELVVRPHDYPVNGERTGHS